MKEFFTERIFHSQLGRQIVLLLLLCGIVPLFLFAFPLYFQTHKVMEDEAVQTLRRDVDLANSQLFQSLQIARRQLNSRNGSSNSSSGSALFTGLSRTRDLQTLANGIGYPWDHLDSLRIRRLKQKKTVITPPYVRGDRTTVSMIAPVGTDEFMVGELRPEFLWNIAISGYFGDGKMILVLDKKNRVLISSSNVQKEPFQGASELVSDTLAGHQLHTGRAQLAGVGSVYWVSKPFWLKGAFGGEEWTLLVMSPARTVETLPLYLLKSLVLWLALALIGLVFLAFQLARRFHEPIALLTRATNRLIQGDWSTELPVDSMGEIGELARSFRDMRDELKSSQEQLRYEALHDKLTGLPNRVLLEDRLQQNIEYARRREDYSFAVLFMDIDRFKIVNDSLGHDVGDDLLRAFGERVKDSLRSADTLARIGGDEFVAVLDDVSNPQDARNFAERIHERLSNPFTIHGHDVFARASMGILIHDPSSYQKPEEILRDADTAMYRAKDLEGSKPYVIFGHTMRKTVQNRLNLETELQHAVRNRDFSMFFQPIMDLTVGRPVGCEVLLRWRHEEHGWVSPSTFIPLAEETDLINQIGEWTLRKSAERFSTWRNQNGSMPLLWMSINVSAHQLSTFDLVSIMDQILQSTTLTPLNIKIEVTESALIKSTESALETLNNLRERGFSICMDDFGTGYSSLAMLHSLPLDILKIDQRFIRQIHKETPNQAIVQAVTAMATKLNLAVVAEGIETRDELEYICQETECGFGQGYLFSHPVREESLLNQLNGGGRLWPPEAFDLIADQLGIFES